MNYTNVRPAYEMQLLHSMAQLEQLQDFIEQDGGMIVSEEKKSLYIDAGKKVFEALQAVQEARVNLEAASNL